MSIQKYINKYVIILKEKDDYMNTYLKKNINTIISIFILISPIMDLITGISLHYNYG